MFLTGRLTVYASPEDKALGFLGVSCSAAGTAWGRCRRMISRCGVQDLFAKLGTIDVIIYEGKPTDHYAHSYFKSNPKVSADLIELIRKQYTARSSGDVPLTQKGKNQLGLSRGMMIAPTLRDCRRVSPAAPANAFANGLAVRPWARTLSMTVHATVNAIVS